MNREDVIGWAREAGLEVHDRKNQARFGIDIITGEDSTAKLQRMCELAAAAERRKHQADIEAWKAEAATAEKWRGMALAKDPMQPGKAVQEIQREAVEREREGCAVACDDRAGTVSMFGTAKECAAHNSAIDECAAAIRARGQA